MYSYAIKGEERRRRKKLKPKIEVMKADRLCFVWSCYELLLISFLVYRDSSIPIMLPFLQFSPPFFISSNITQVCFVSHEIQHAILILPIL